jgi:hypothetical protein
MLKLNQPAPDFSLPAYQKGLKEDYKELKLKDLKHSSIAFDS